MMRTIAFATLFAATLFAPRAFAQASYQHHPICLRAATGLECAFNTMAECRQAAVGTSGALHPQHVAAESSAPPALKL